MTLRSSGVRLACAVALFLSFAVSAQAATPAPDLATYADQVLSTAYPADQPGAAALVIQNGKVVLRKGYGMANLDLGVPVSPDMVFELGSITKQFTAASILLLQERGQLRVEDDITKYLTDYPIHGETITIEHLLTHTSGIPSYTGLPEWLPRVREDMTLQTLIGLFKDKPLEFKPGEKWAYNNSGYILLGAIIEKVSGKSYEQFVEEEIFARLGMKNSRYGHAREVVSRRASGYSKDNDSGRGFQNAEYLSMTQPYAAGSLMSTVDDLAIWDKALGSEALLKKASLDRMFTPYKLKSGTNTYYAYGIGATGFEGHRLIEHGGGIFGFVTHMVRVPEKGLFVAILSNNDSPETPPNDLSLRIVAKALGQPLEDRKTVQLDPQTLDEYVGVYRFDERTTRTISRDGAKLFSQRNGSEKREILATAKDDFFFMDGGARLRFRRDPQGKVTGATFTPRSGPEEEGRKTDEAPTKERQAIQLDPALYDAYVGEYELAPNFSITVTREGNQIFGQATGQPKFELFPESETSFFLKVVDAQLEFVRDADGKVTGAILHQGGRDMPGKRK